MVSLFNKGGPDFAMLNPADKLSIRPPLAERGWRSTGLRVAAHRCACASASHLRELVVFCLRPLGGGPIGKARDVVRELLALRNHFEHCPPPQARADDDIGGGE